MGSSRFPMVMLLDIPALESVTRFIALDRFFCIATVGALGCNIALLVIRRREFLAGSLQGINSRDTRLASRLFGVSLLLCLAMVSLNTHRLQAWTYHAIVMFWLLWLTPNRFGLNLIRYFTISIYVYSAFGKLDSQFLHTTGREMIVVLANWGLPRDPSITLNDGWYASLPAILPVVELLIAFGLCFRKTQCVAGIAAMGMHFGLVCVLGPLGMNNELAVILWNIEFLLIAGLLFVAPTMGWVRSLHSRASGAETPTANKLSTGGDYESRATRDRTSPITNRIALFGCCLIMSLPMLERFGYWDHWSSWALYAPHSSRVRLEVAPNVLGDLPIEMSIPFEEKSLFWVPVPIDQWSLQTVSAPIYPQDRFQIGVATQLIEGLPVGSWRLHWYSQADRWTGQREHRELNSVAQIEQFTKRFWLNAKPRRVR